VTGLEPLFSLDGRVAVVTGATGTLGRAAAAALHGAGARVVPLSRSHERGEALLAELGAAGPALVADVLDEASLAAARDAVVGALGRVDILVTFAGGNLAGATAPPGETILDLPAAATAEVVDLNLMGTLLPIRAFVPAMLAGEGPPGGASVVTVASVSSLRPLSRVSGYSAAKAAVVNLTQALAVELGRRHRGRIRVNSLAPGFFVADQNRAMLLGAGGEPTERGRAILDRTPLDRFGAPEELGGALVWLCGPSAAFVTGALIAVDGGFTAGSGV
jgi:NAD(P)-dependent dehydrogenase (short-subunit alcohol dehydrogenase family)